MNAAALELGLSTSATQAEQIAAVKTYLIADLKRLVVKNVIDAGRSTGEATAVANLPDFTQIS